MGVRRVADEISNSTMSWAELEVTNRERLGKVFHMLKLAKTRQVNMYSCELANLCPMNAAFGVG